MPCPRGTFPHTIRPGDTYWRLAEQYRTPPEAIAAFNPAVNPWDMITGTTLCIPTGYRPAPWFPAGPRPWRPWWSRPRAACPPGLRRYVVQPGDTIGEIAYRRGVRPDVILSYNRVDPRNLRPGQTLCIP